MDAATQRLLVKSPLLSGLRRDVVTRLVAGAELRELPRHGAVWGAGDGFAGVGLVRSGVLRESVGHGGEELVLRFVARGEWVGETTLLAGGAHHTDLVAHETSVLVWIAAPALEPLDAALARRLGSAVAERCRSAELRHAGSAYRTVQARVASVVLELAGSIGVRDSRGVIVNLRLTRRDLASLAGTTRESTSAVVGQWQRAGVVETEARRLVVLDPDRLERLAGGAPLEATPTAARR
jgi:CRP-like cAMP-binding protein